jgi:hypothetical protein
MVSSLTRNQVRRKPLRVRLPCPPLLIHKDLRQIDGLIQAKQKE